MWRPRTSKARAPPTVMKGPVERTRFVAGASTLGAARGSVLQVFLCALVSRPPFVLLHSFLSPLFVPCPCVLFSCAQLRPLVRYARR